MYKPGGTLRDALSNIEHKKWVLPAIQREFVWTPDQVCALFDSLMQGFPFGTFLFWKIEPEHSGDWIFYDFVREYHERDAPHCPKMGPISGRALTAVLDGQQRLTALNIGLRGSLALRRKYQWRNNPNAYPKLKLYLNLLSSSEVDDKAEQREPITRERYQFKFLDSKRAYVAGKELWFAASEILSISSGPNMLTWLVNQGLANDELQTAFRTLDLFHQVVHKDQVIYYYEEESADIDRVLNIFIRLNHQGAPLSQSDLLHSIATAQWSGDARHEIESLVDDLNRAGAWFGLTKNFVLKAGLMLTDVASVGFKVENFTRKNMGLLEANWDKIRNALLLTVRLVTNFGLNGQTIRASSALLPIAYYFYVADLPESFLTHSKYADDRNAIRRWLVASLLKPSGIWGSGLDTLLTQLRAVIRENHEKFPAESLRTTMAQRGKSLAFSEVEIERLVDSEYSSKGTFLLLSLLYPFVDLRNRFHVDHIFPAGLLTMSALRKEGLEQDKVDWIFARRNQLPNLQLLEGAENNEKRKRLPAEWAEIRYPDASDRRHYLQIHDMGNLAPSGVGEFIAHFEGRRTRLLDRIRAVLNG